MAMESMMAWRKRSVVAGVGAHYVAQIHRMLLAQAQQQPALHGDPHAVAALAEVVRMRRDEADLGAGAVHRPVARRPAGGLGGGQQLVARLDDRAHLIAGHVDVGAVVLVDLAQRHLLDEGDVHAPLDRRTRPDRVLRRRCGCS